MRKSLMVIPSCLLATLAGALILAGSAGADTITCSTGCSGPAAPPAQGCAPVNETVTPGLVHLRTAHLNGSCVNALVLDLKAPGLQAIPFAVAAGGTCQTVSSLATAAGAIAGVNGGFFCFETPSLCSFSAAQCPTACTGFSLLKQGDILRSTNCSEQSQPAYWRTTFGIQGSSAPSFQPIAPGADWPGMTAAVGAGPTLVAPSPGGPVVDVTQEGFGWECQRHPRTAAGLTLEGKLVLVTVDSPGLCLSDLASFLIQQFSVYSAMNLDGGGSTTMVIQGKLVNTPSGNGERAVYDGVFIVPSVGPPAAKKPATSAAPPR
jgi:exopolysaccharide biosynthesis protein